MRFDFDEQKEQKTIITKTNIDTSESEVKAVKNLEVYKLITEKEEE